MEKIPAVTYVLLIVLQIAWHALAPAPAGNGSWLLAGVAVLPLLLPLRGVLKGSLRAMTWAGFLVLAYFIVGVMEAWSNPAQRVAAVTQIILSCAFIGGTLAFSRRPPASPG